MLGKHIIENASKHLKTHRQLRLDLILQLTHQDQYTILLPTIQNTSKTLKKMTKNHSKTHRQLRPDFILQLTHYVPYTILLPTIQNHSKNHSKTHLFHPFYKTSKYSHLQIGIIIRHAKHITRKHIKNRSRGGKLSKENIKK